MAKKADIGSKRLISLAPNAWVQWVTQQPDLVAREILGSDFQWLSRESDVLVKVYSPQRGEFLVLNELQLRYKLRMPVRMRAYAALAEEKYHLPTYPVLVNILPPPANLTIQDRFESEIFGLRALQDYRVINLWQVEAQQVFEQNLSTLLPFVPILKGGAEPTVVQRALQLLQADEQFNELESLLAFFASFVLKTNLVQQILRWDMTVLRESPWYQEILQEGLNQGLQHERSLLLRMLTHKFPEIDLQIQNQIQTLSPEQLEDLGVALLDFAQPADLTAWLQQQSET